MPELQNVCRCDIFPFVEKGNAIDGCIVGIDSREEHGIRILSEGVVAQAGDRAGLHIPCKAILQTDPAFSDHFQESEILNGTCGLPDAGRTKPVDGLTHTLGAVSLAGMNYNSIFHAFGGNPFPFGQIPEHGGNPPKLFSKKMSQRPAVRADLDMREKFGKGLSRKGDRELSAQLENSLWPE